MENETTTVYSEEEVRNALKLLIEMRENCYFRRADQAYDDPKRMEKYKALKIACTAIEYMPTYETEGL